MKLIFCPYCHDLFRLTHKKKFCECRKSFGKYLDDISAEINKNAVPIGIENKSFRRALENRSIFDIPKGRGGVRFISFIIPGICDSVKVERGGKLSGQDLKICRKYLSWFREEILKTRDVDEAIEVCDLEFSRFDLKKEDKLEIEEAKRIIGMIFKGEL